MRVRYLFLALLFTSMSASGQIGNSNYKVTKQKVISSGEYYYGEGISPNGNRAQTIAIRKLLNSIAVNVSASFERLVKEEDREVEETVKDVVNTYSTATLKNVQKVQTFEDDKLKFFNYIKKSKVNKIFEIRKELIKDIFDQAKDYHKQRDLTNALKKYYFSIILMNSIPEQVIKYHDENLTALIPNKINEIISNTNFVLEDDRKISENERELILKITYNGKPVQNIDFTFWDGSNYVEVNASDGFGVVELLGSSTQQSKLRIQVKYNYFENRNEIKAVGDLWDLVTKPNFSNTKVINLSAKEFIPVTISTVPEQAEVYVDDKYIGRSGQYNIKEGSHTFRLKKPGFEEIEKKVTVSNSNNEFAFELSKAGSSVYAASETPEFNYESDYKLNIEEESGCNKTQKIGEQTLRLLELIKRENKSGIKTFLGDDHFLTDKLLKIMKYNDITIVDKAINADINKTYDGWELRKVRVKNKYRSLNKQSIEYLIFDFDEKGNLYDVNYGINKTLYDRFVKASEYGKDWKRKQIIIKFVEKYRTTFLSRNLHMLENIFAEEAVIIVGKILEKNEVKNKDMYNYVKLNDNQPDVAYLQMKKDEYIARQKRLFKQKRDLFIDFSSFKINRKNKKEGVYGVSMRQSYYSTGYSDEGYLFLLVDFLQEQPQIYVRSWQPQEWDDSSLIRLSNFKINR